MAVLIAINIKMRAAEASILVMTLVVPLMSFEVMTAA
jgi:hypothetical protein